MIRKTIFSLAVLLLASAPLALAQGTYTQIDYPGATYTVATGIDSAGDVVGYYPRTDEDTFHGFLISGGVDTTIDYPGASSTVASGINDMGKIVGWAALSYSLTVGFIYDIPTGTFTDVSFPGNNTIVTEALAINNAGTVVGFTRKGFFQTVEAGFQLVGETYKTFVPNGFDECILIGVNNLGETVGYSSSPSDLNFLFYPGKFQSINVPGESPWVSGINDSNTIVGFEYTSRSRKTVQGFLFQAGNPTQKLQFPSASQTYANGINNAGMVVGSFLDTSESEHGFTWTPPAAAEKK